MFQDSSNLLQDSSNQPAPGQIKTCSKTVHTPPGRFKPDPGAIYFQFVNNLLTNLLTNCKQIAIIYHKHLQVYEF